MWDVSITATHFSFRWISVPHANATTSATHTEMRRLFLICIHARNIPFDVPTFTYFKISFSVSVDRGSNLRVCVCGGSSAFRLWLMAFELRVSHTTFSNRICGWCSRICRAHRQATWKTVGGIRRSAGVLWKRTPHITGEMNMKWTWTWTYPLSLLNVSTELIDNDWRMLNKKKIIKHRHDLICN